MKLQMCLKFTGFKKRETRECEGEGVWCSVGATRDLEPRLFV